MLTNDAARLASDHRIRSREALLGAGFRVVRLFSPEHGLGADAPDGQVVHSRTDALTGLPVISLYGEQRAPALDQIADLDAVVVDLPEMGVRFYTYQWTLTHLMDACAAAGKPMIVLDRPNPLGGDMSAVEGPILDEETCASFLGRAPVPIRHCLTIGELARFWNQRAAKPVILEVVPCTGWRREMLWPETGLPFVPPSPAIRSFNTALLYPGICLFEATNLSLGRGTNTPFELLGAPWLQNVELARRFNEHGPAAGIVAYAAGTFTPMASRWQGNACQSLGLRVESTREARPVRAGLVLLALVIAMHRDRFEWASYPTAANPSGDHHFDLLIGQKDLSRALWDDPDPFIARAEEITAAPGWGEALSDLLLY